MALQITEFFGFKPLDPRAKKYIENRLCPFTEDKCLKPKHGACSGMQISGDPVIFCPNRMYSERYAVLKDIADDVFDSKTKLIDPDEYARLRMRKSLTGNEVVVFGQGWRNELPLPTPPGSKKQGAGNFYVDWVIARLSASGNLDEMTAIEVQTIDTTGSYKDQVNCYFREAEYIDAQGRQPGFSNSGFNWENVNKRILPQLIYKGHVLRLEPKCSKGLFFVCSIQVLNRVRNRLGGKLRAYRKGPGTVTFKGYKLAERVKDKPHRALELAEEFTTTVDQIANAFTSPGNLPEEGVYERAILTALN